MGPRNYVVFGGSRSDIFIRTLEESMFSRYTIKLAPIKDRDQTDRVTALPRSLPMTLTFNPVRAIVMTHTEKNSSSKIRRFKRQSGNKPTDRWTLPIDLPF